MHMLIHKVLFRDNQRSIQMYKKNDFLKTHVVNSWSMARKKVTFLDVEMLTILYKSCDCGYLVLFFIIIINPRCQFQCGAIIFCHQILFSLPSGFCLIDANVIPETEWLGTSRGNSIIFYNIFP